MGEMMGWDTFFMIIGIVTAAIVLAVVIALLVEEIGNKLWK